MSGGWIHSFAVTDTQTHKNGYTIYKIASIVFPRAIPEALTYITVWKRFHDIKRLHRELSRRQKSLKIIGEMPEPTDSTYFKRFDSDVIQRRREFIIRFLDFVAQHPALYKSHIFFQFFNDNPSVNESPLHKLHVENGNGVYSSLAESIKDDKMTNSVLMDTNMKELKPDERRSESMTEKEHVSVNENAIPTESIEEIKPAKDTNDSPKKSNRDFTRFLTPMASIESEDSDFIYEAALEFSRAVQAEANLEYNEAHMRYKRGVEILLSGSKADTNEERKFIAKTKISKYLARADDIYQKFLCTGNNSYDENSPTAKSRLHVQLSFEGNNPDDLHSTYYIERPINHLAKYKVMNVLGQRVIQVQCVTDPQRPTYVIKGIEKPSSNAPTQTIFLPQHVPYMVDLLSFFQSDQKIYLLLRHAEGGRLLDYVESYQSKTEKNPNFDGIFPEVANEKPQNTCEDRTELESHNEILRSSQRLLLTVTNTLNNANACEESNSIEQPESHINLAAGSIEKSCSQLPEVSVKQWARELFVAIESLHEKGVILADLHMHNLLLGSKGQLLLTYFYQNQTVFEESHSFFALSEHCVAPERPLTFKSDWWSFGVILYQLLLGLSFKSMHPGRIDIYGFVQYPENVNISDSGRDLLDNLLTQQPEDRFDAEDLRAHEFFKDTNWNEVRQNGLNSHDNASKQN